MLALVRGLTWRWASLGVVDFLLIMAGVLAAVAIRLGPPPLELFSWHILSRATLIAVVLQLALHISDFYSPTGLQHRRDMAMSLLQALGAASLILALLFYWLPTLLIGRGIVLIASVLVVTLIVGWRLLFEWLSSRVGPAARQLIVGTSSAAIELARELYERRHSLGVELVGFIDADESKVGMSLINPGVVGTISDIPRIVRERQVDRVVVSLANARGKFSMDELLEMKLKDGVHFDHLATVYERYTGKIAVENLRPSWLVFSDGFRKTKLLSYSKRLLDLVLATIGLVVLSPTMMAVAVIIRLSSPGTALYHQTRVGQYGRVFTVHKFRSMRHDAEAATGAVWSTQNDPRVTAFGRFMRRTRIDELPQLWNVLRGEMSFVGPRPERPEFVDDLTRQIPFYGQRHAVPPGLTGWAQVRCEYGSSVEDSMQKLQYDLYYIKNLSLALDLFIVLETVKTVLVRRGS